MKIKCTFDQMKSIFSSDATGAYETSGSEVERAWYPGTTMVLELDPKPTVADFTSFYPSFTEVQDISE